MKRRLGYHTVRRAGIDRASLVEIAGDDFYARELVVAATEAYVKRLHAPRRAD